MNKATIILIIVSLLVSCEEKKIVYEYLAFRDNNTKIWKDTIPEKWKDKMENGDWTLNDEKDNLLFQGKFNRGFRTGGWMYYPSDSQTVKIDWTKYVDKNETVAINYPKEWEIHEAENIPFQATFPLKENENKKGKYFVIVNNIKDSIKLTLEAYLKYYKSRMFKTEKVKEFAFFELETISGKHFYFSRYILERNNESILALSFISDIESKIYDISYVSLYEEKEKKHIIFFDMIRSLVLEKQRFFSPFDVIKSFKQVDYPEKEEIIS